MQLGQGAQVLQALGRRESQHGADQGAVYSVVVVDGRSPGSTIEGPLGAGVLDTRARYQGPAGCARVPADEQHFCVIEKRIERRLKREPDPTRG
jgi:hypothetical protein